MRNGCIKSGIDPKLTSRCIEFDMRCGGRIDRLIADIVIALCADFFRRRTAIEEKSVSHRTDTEYRYLNFKIHDACAGVVGEELCDSFIRFIGGRIGYAKCDLDIMSEVTYKRYKHRATVAIALSLHLVD